MSDEELKALQSNIEELERRLFALEHPYYCYKCSEDFGGSNALWQHSKAKHDGVPSQ